MALSIDSGAVLRAITENPNAFPAVQADLDEFARKMLGKQIKAKTTDAALFKEIYRVTGATNMSTVLDGYAANELAALIKKIDPYSPYAKSGGDLQEARAHIAAVATGSKPFSAKPEKAQKVPTPKPPKREPLPKIGGVLESKVHSGKSRPSRSKR